MQNIFYSHGLHINEIDAIINAFDQSSWTKKTKILFEQYIKEQNVDSRHIVTAYVDNNFGGYATLCWKSSYSYFLEHNIPEIKDLNVLPLFRKIGIGSHLMGMLELEVEKRRLPLIGIGVGLYGGADGGYGMAQRLYVKRGYIPDGKGVTYCNKSVIPGQSYPIDDDLVLWFIKKLKNIPNK